MTYHPGKCGGRQLGGSFCSHTILINSTKRLDDWLGKLLSNTSSNQKGVADMNALEELISIINEFTPDQLEAFLRHPLTVEILQAGATAEPSPPAEP